MIEEPPKLTVQRPARRPSEDLIAAFRGVPTGFVVDAQGGGGAMTAAVGPVATDRGWHVAGPALTCGNGPGDILGTLAGLALVQPGDVLVAEAQGFQGCAAAGDRVAAMARNAGAAALVTDGPVRDLAGILKAGLPVWATGITPNSPVSKGPARVGLPAVVGGRPVETGDMIVADRDGVVVVPFADIRAVVDALPRVRALEEALDDEVRAGLTRPASIDALLQGDEVRWLE